MTNASTPGSDSGSVTLVESTWERIRADVLSHMLTAALLVLVVRVPMPPLSTRLTL